MTTKYYALLTNLGASKLANAAALGTKLQITQMAVGDGGGTLPTPNATQTKLIGEKRRAALNSLSIDAANSSQIIAEQVIPETEGGFWIREIGLLDADGVLIAVANCAETYKPQLQEGSGRTQTVRMILIVSSTDAVTLKIDPSIVLATRQYVDNAVIEVKAYVDDLMAKHVNAADPHTQYAPKKDPTLTGTPKAPTPAASKNDTQIATTAFGQALMKAHTDATDPHSQYLQKTQLSSDINSASETQAATPKAVKAVNDAALKFMGNIATGVDLNTLGSTSQGRWGVTSSAAMSNSNMPEAALGYLDITPYGPYGLTQTFTTRYGTQYVRGLSGAWNGTNGPWADWLPVGFATNSVISSDDSAAMVTPGRFSVSSTVANLPLSQAGVTEVTRYNNNITTVYQTYKTMVAGAAYKNRTFTRTLSSGVWTDWAEGVTMPAAAYPSTASNVTGPMLFGFDGASTDQAVTHQPIAGEMFGGVTVPRGLRPSQFGVSGRGVTATFWFRGFNGASSDQSEWKQVITTTDDASLTKKGIVKLSSAADSADEASAATPKAVKSVADALPPVGIPMPWPMATPPTGWLKCNGATFSATTYPALAKAYPTLKLPDLRGEFIRGWDDGRSVDAGRAILSAQGDAIRNITGLVSGSGGVQFDSFSGALFDSGSRDATVASTTGKSGFTDDIYFDASRVVPTASENRPRNIAFNYIVRAA